MALKPIHAVAAAATAGLLGFGGMSLASAQEDSTTTTEAPAVTDDTTVDDSTVDGEDCPHDGDGVGDTGDSTDSTDSTTDSSS